MGNPDATDADAEAAEAAAAAEKHSDEEGDNEEEAVGNDAAVAETMGRLAVPNDESELKIDVAGAGAGDEDNDAPLPPPSAPPVKGCGMSRELANAGFKPRLELPDTTEEPPAGLEPRPRL